MLSPFITKIFNLSKKSTAGVANNYELKILSIQFPYIFGEVKFLRHIRMSKVKQVIRK